MTEYNKVVYDGQTLIDLTQDDVQASDVRNGVYFHSADGVRSQGTMQTSSKNVWSGGCSSSATTTAKVATTIDGDFELETGNIVYILMEYANQVGSPSLSVDGCTAKDISGAEYGWRGGEVVGFMYDGSEFVLIDSGIATGTYYGVTKLSSSVSSTSTTLASTPSAVKQAYDLANNATATPTADTKAKFDSDAHMNSEDMTSQEVSDFVDGLNVSGINAVDYIVEQGTDGIWTYRKWNSGIAECWGTYEFASASFSATGSVYYRSIQNIVYPTSLFTQTPIVFASIQMGNIGGCTVIPSSTSFSVSILSAVSTARDGYVFAHCKGTWK